MAAVAVLTLRDAALVVDLPACFCARASFAKTRLPFVTRPPSGEQRLMYS